MLSEQRLDRRRRVWGVRSCNPGMWGITGDTGRSAPSPWAVFSSSVSEEGASFLEISVETL